MSRAGKLAVGAVAALGGAFVTYWLYLAFLPEETRIRRMVERLQEAFNEGRAGEIAASLTEDFSDPESRLSREEIRGFLIRFFLTERDRRTRELRYLVRVEREEVQVEVRSEEPAAAALEATARFFERRGEPRLVGVLVFSAELKKVDGEWRIARARHRTTEGRLPF